MRAMLLWILAALGGCAVREKPPDAPPQPWEDQLGRTLTREGTALNSKGGAVLKGADDWIWVDLKEFWPERAVGKRVRVTGVVTRKDDLPVFIPEPGELPKQGIPVPPGTDLEKARIRYVLFPVRWTLLDDPR